MHNQTDKTNLKKEITRFVKASSKSYEGLLNHFLAEDFVPEDFVIAEKRTTLSCFAISWFTEDEILADISLTSR